MCELAHSIEFGVLSYGVPCSWRIAGLALGLDMLVKYCWIHGPFVSCSDRGQDGVKVIAEMIACAIHCSRGDVIFRSALRL